MNKEETRADNEMRQRWIDGEIAQFYSASMDNWVDCPDQDRIGWDKEIYIHRIKPKPTTRQWTMEECPVGETVLRKGFNTKHLIIAAYGNTSILGGGVGGQSEIDYQCLLENHTMLDGSPCGITESSDD